MNDSPWAFRIQICLIIIYLILAVMFSFNKKTIPLSIYYAGCFIKDGAVLALAWLNIK